jgi:hypothetical protein
LGDATGGLSDDLQVVDNPDLKHLVVLKGQAIRDALFDLLRSPSEYQSADPGRFS